MSNEEIQAKIDEQVALKSDALSNYGLVVAQTISLLTNAELGKNTVVAEADKEIARLTSLLEP